MRPIVVKSAEEFKEAQKILFEMGYEWQGSKKAFRSFSTTYNCIEFNKVRMTISVSSTYGIKSKRPIEITMRKNGAIYFDDFLMQLKIKTI